MEAYTLQMARAKKIAEVRDAKTGEALVQFMGPAREDDALSVALRLLTHQLMATGHGDGASGGLFGGQFGYGVDFENAVFEMHRARADYDCTCEAENPVHADTCARVTQREAWRRARLQYASETKTDADREAEIASSIERGMPRNMAILGACSYQVDFNKLIEYDTRYPFPACSCGALEAFVPSDRHAADCQRTIADKPNFLHKPTGLSVRWYKYIGRDMEIEHTGDVTLREMLESCLESIGVDSLDAAASAFSEAEREEVDAFRRSMEFWQSS